jgi:stage II sporulation protein R
MNITLGKADGKNWWCVLYPPLCFTNLDHVTLLENEKQLKDFFTEEDYLMITAEENGTLPIRFRFKILELFAP